MSQPPRHACSPADFVRSAWGVGGTFSPLPGDVDENWRLDAESGKSFLLKVSSAESALDELAALARVQLELAEERWPVPEPQAVLGGTGHGRFVTRAEHRPEGGWASLQSWLTGVPAGDVDDLGSRYPARLGRFLARLDRSLAEFDEPALERSHAWDLLTIPRKLPELGAIENSTRRRTVQRWIEHFRDELLPSLRSRPKSLIHGDANDHNVLVAPSGDGQHSIVGVIDFGDALAAPRVLEPAIAAAYVALESSQPVRAVSQLLESYTNEWPLDLALGSLGRREIVLCLRMRIVQTAITAAVNATTRSDSYASIHAAPAWAIIDSWDTAGWNEL